MWSSDRLRQRTDLRLPLSSAESLSWMALSVAPTTEGTTILRRPRYPMSTT